MRSNIILIIVSLLLLLASLSLLSSKTNAETGYTVVTVVQAKTMIDTNPSLFILDVRNQSEYVTGHIRNAHLIPLFQLNTSLGQLNPSDEILVYCRSGARSTTASQILAADGFTHLYNMAGGIVQWETEGYPTYVNYPSIQAAVDNATAGATLYIGSNQYFEHVTINQSINLIGENSNLAIIDGNGNDTVISINVDNVSISNFKIQYSGCSCAGLYGIDLGTNRNNINITDNTLFSDSIGITVQNAQNIIVSGNNISSSRDYSMFIQNSENIVISGNTFENNLNQVNVKNSTQMTIVNNILTNNGEGLTLQDSNNNTITGNSFNSNKLEDLYLNQSNNNEIVDNSFLSNETPVSLLNSICSWDNGFEGNYWSNYTGTDADNDGIGDTPVTISANNVDHYPLMGAVTNYPISPINTVEIASNTTISAFNFALPHTISFNVSNADANQTTGFCRISIPYELINPANGSIQVIIDGGLTQVTLLNSSVYDNGTYRWIYFTFPLTVHNIVIVPEFSLLLLPLLTASAAIVLFGFSKIRRRNRKRLT